MMVCVAHDGHAGAPVVRGAECRRMRKTSELLSFYFPGPFRRHALEHYDFEAS
jgi:hypothetical protein